MNQILVAPSVDLHDEDFFFCDDEISYVHIYMYAYLCEIFAARGTDTQDDDISIHICIRELVHMYTIVCIYTCLHIHVYTYIRQVFASCDTDDKMCIYIYMYIYVIYIYTYIYIVYIYR